MRKWRKNIAIDVDDDCFGCAFESILQENTRKIVSKKQLLISIDGKQISMFIQRRSIFVVIVRTLSVSIIELTPAGIVF